MSPVKTGYWNIRGFHQPICFLLAHAGVEYEDRRYHNHEAHIWMQQDKKNLGFDFPNLPYYMDDDVKLTQSFAILKYLGRKHGLAPVNEAQQIRVDLIEAEAMDMRTKWTYMCYYTPDFEREKPDFIKTLRFKAEEVSKFLGDHHYFAGGDKLTYVDFLMYDLLYIHCLVATDLLDPFPNLQAFQARIGGLEKVAAYINSDKCVSYPLMAPWSNIKENPK